MDLWEIATTIIHFIELHLPAIQFLTLPMRAVHLALSQKPTKYN